MVGRFISLEKDDSYQISRLFHRSLIKYLSGKRDIGVSVANEIVTFMNFEKLIDEVNYKQGIAAILKKYDEQFPLPLDYLNLLCKNDRMCK